MRSRCRLSAPLLCHPPTNRYTAATRSSHCGQHHLARSPPLTATITTTPPFRTSLEAGSCGYDALLDSGLGRTRRPARRAWRSGSRMILTDQRARQSGRGASSSTRWRKLAAYGSLAVRIGREHDRVCPKRRSRPPTITPARGIPGVGVRFVGSRADSSSSAAEQVVEVRGERGSALVGPDRGVHAASTCRDARAPQIATSFAAIALRFSTRPTTRRDFLQSASHFHASHDVQILPNLPQN